MNVLFCGGGTAGHVTPALAVAEEFKRTTVAVSLLYVGRRGGKENDAVRKAGIPLKTIETVPIPRKIGIAAVKSVFSLFKSIKEAYAILKKFRPDAVFATGGYVSFPILYAAKRKKIPYFLHESNSVFGTVTKCFASKAQRVFCSFDMSDKAQNAVYVGTPLRVGSSRIDPRKARKELGVPSDAYLVISFGGSGGASALNEAILSAIEIYQKEKDRFLPHNKSVYFVHSLGFHYEKVLTEQAAKIADLSRSSRIVSYLDRMDYWLNAADLAVTRSGAMTIAELAAANCPAILIPSPNVTADHQRKNAQAYKNAGACTVLEEEVLSGERLMNEIANLLSRAEKLDAMKLCARKVAVSNNNAAKNIVRIMNSEISAF